MLKEICCLKRKLENGNPRVSYNLSAQSWITSFWTQELCLTVYKTVWLLKVVEGLVNVMIMLKMGEPLGVGGSCRIKGKKGRSRCALNEKNGCWNCSMGLPT